MNSLDTTKLSLALKAFLSTKYLWGLYALLFLALGGVLGFSAWYGQNQHETSAATQTHSIAVALDELNRRQIQTMAIPLDLVTVEIEKHGGLTHYSPAKLENLFREVKENLKTSQIRSLFAVDKEGNFLVASSKVSRVVRHANYRDRPDFEYVKTQKGLTVLTSMVAESDGKKVLVMMRAMKTARGRFAGIIGVTKSFDDFETFYKSLDLRLPITFAMIRDDGKVLYRYPSGDLEMGNRLRVPEDLNINTEGAADFENSADKVERVGYYKFASDYGTMIFVGYDVNQVFAKWRTVLRTGAILFIVFMTALAALVRMAQSRQEGVEKVLESYRRRHQLLRQLQHSTEYLTGADFLKQLLRSLCQAFEAKDGVIGVLLPEHSGSVKCVVNYTGGEFVAETIYDLRHSPFNDLPAGEFFTHPKHSSQIYPEDEFLGHREIQSSFGTVLKGSDQQPVGVVMIYNETELSDLPFKRSILSVYSSRIAAELERAHTDELRKEVESLRKQIEERTLQSQKMEAIGSLAEGVAHDFNNILAIVLASTEKMLNLHKDSSEDQHYLDSIKKACHRARHLVSQILVFNQKDEVVTQPVSMSDVFVETLDFLKTILPEDICVVLDYGECRNLKINADVNQLQQALINLCVNASKSLGFDGGEIRISLQKNRIQERPYIKCIVHYSGEEMGREEIEKIFNPFYAQNIGMVVVQRIVTNHQGFIEVKSEGGHGTDYEIFLPVLESEAPAEIQKSRILKTEKKVLIVDDEPEIGLLIKELLENEGLQVEAETDPIYSLAKFKNAPSEYFMIISDLAMPEMSGFDLCREIRVLNPKIPVILWSGYHQYLDEEALDLNVKVLSKPVDVQKLLQLINTEVSQLSSQGISSTAVGLGSAL